MGVGNRRRAAARRHRVHHRRQHQRRHHSQHHHRAHHHRRAHHNVTHVGLALFGAQRHPRTPQGNQATVVTTVSTTTSSSSTSGNHRRLPPWCGCVVVSSILLAVSIVGFAVPAVPIPVGITSMFMFCLIIVVPFVSNLLRTRAARREGVVDDPEAPPPSTVTGGGRTVVITEMSTVDEAGSANGPLGGIPVFNYDPPPSFTEAMADTASPSAPWVAGAPAQTPPGYPSIIGGTLQDPVYPPMGAPLKEEALPPPPSYDDVISGGNTYTPQ